MGSPLKILGHHLACEASQHPMETLAVLGKITTFVSPVLIPFAIGGAIGLGIAAIIDSFNDTTTDSFNDNIYFFNKSLDAVYVAIHRKVNQKWDTKYWVKVPSNERACILSEKLESQYIYCCGRTLDASKYWGNGDYKKTLDQSLYKFTLFNTGSSRGDFVINYTV